MRKDKMGRFLEWWKAPGRYWEDVPESGHAGAGNPGENGSEERKRSGEKRYVTLLKSLLLAALPLLCCLVHCIGQGQSLGKVYIPSSGWNDELFYYKQVESILEYGYPQGYFGFNESHALKLSFAAWSPVLVFPWILWGLVFGWNLMSPVICNIFLMSLCCFLFVWLVRPTWKQMGILTLLFCLYRPFVRYMLSGMAEVICFAILILFYSMAINYLRRERDYKLVLLFLVSGLMVLMRPYMALFMLLPVYFWMRRGRSRAGKLCRGAAGAAVLAAVLGIYAVINHYLGAEYFTPLFYTDWIQAFFDRGIFGGGYYTVRKIYYVGQDFLEHVRASFGSGLSADACFVCYLVCMAVLAAQGLEKVPPPAGRRGAGGQGGNGNSVSGAKAGSAPGGCGRVSACVGKDGHRDTSGFQLYSHAFCAAAYVQADGGQQASDDFPGCGGVRHSLDGYGIL